MAERAVVTYGLRRDVGPAEALLEEVQWTAGHVAWLREQVQGFEVGDLSWGVAERKEGLADSDGRPVDSSTYRAAPPVLLQLYAAERKHLVEVTRAALAANVSERQVALAERQGALLVAGLAWLAGRLGLDAGRQSVWQADVPVMLRMLAAGQIEGA